MSFTVSDQGALYYIVAYSGTVEPTQSQVLNPSTFTATLISGFVDSVLTTQVNLKNIANVSLTSLIS
jgi:hypothetical protein